MKTGEPGAGQVVAVGPEDERLGLVVRVMRELRDAVSAKEFAERYAEQYGQGYRLVALFADGECRAAAGYRLLESFAFDRELYIDDLVTASPWRGQGYGKLLNDYLVEVARSAGCQTIALDSGTHRFDAHRFYFREGYVITSFRFQRNLARAR